MRNTKTKILIAITGNFFLGRKEREREPRLPGERGGGCCIINLHLMIQTHNMDVDTWLTILTISLNLNPYYGFEL